MRQKEIPSRLSAVLAVWQPERDPVLEQLAARVMPQFQGKESLYGTWVFPSSASATVAAHELFRLSKEEVIVVVLTGETEASGPTRGVLSERAKEACHAIQRLGVYVCPATQLIAVDLLPGDLWFLDVGRVAIESGGVEHLYALCHGQDDPGTIQVSPKGSSIPRPSNSFIGREDDLQKVAHILSQWFLVTVTGLPGSGKSVFAMVLARALEDDYPAGVFWIDASSCRNGDELLAKLQRATSHGRPRRVEPLHVLANRLSELHALIVFDNGEELVDEIRAITDALVSQTTTLGVLVTSTIALRTAPEHMYVLGPLSLPKKGEEFQIFKDFSSDAVALFAERAEAVREDFTLTTENVEMVTDICRALSANPLAIEIAASKMAGRTLQSVEKQVAKSLTLRHETPVRPHHASVKQAFMRSITALPGNLAKVLKELCLFADTFTFEQAEAIWPEDADEFIIGDKLHELVRRSLLVFDRVNSRYYVPRILKLLITTHAGYIQEVGEGAQRFCRRMFQVMVEGRQLFNQKKDDEALALLDSHYDNIEAALRYGCVIPELQSEVPDLLLTLPHYWVRRNMIINCDQLASFVMEHVDMDAKPRAELLILVAAALIERHDFDGGRQFLLEAGNLCSDTLIQHRVHGNLGLMESKLGNYATAHSHLEKALEFGIKDGDPFRTSNVALGWASTIGEWVDMESPQNSDELLAKGEDLVAFAIKKLGKDPGNFWTDTINSASALLAWCRGDAQQARKYYILAALACEANNCEPEAALGLERLALMCTQQGLYQDAAKFVGLAVRIRVSKDRPRTPIDQDRFDHMWATLSIKLGKTRFKEYCDYGASSTISDLCVLP